MTALARSRWQKYLVLSVTSLGAFMATLDASITNIALPEITAYYRAPLGVAEWVVMIYLLLISSLLLTYGRLGDMYGHKPVCVGGLAVFTLGSALNSLAPSIYFLIAARALQAVGAGLLMAVIQAIIADTFDASERGRAIGINSVFVSLGLATGPTIGGLLVTYFGWQSIFSINVPVGLVATVWAWRVLPHRAGKPQRFDVPGALAIFVSLAAFLLAMSHGQAWGWRSAAVLGLLILAAGALGLFLLVEGRSDHPMVRLELFRNRLFSAANLAALLNYVTQYAVIFLMPFYLQTILLLPANLAGVVMTAFPLTMMLTAPVSGALSDRMGSRVLSSAGMGIVAAAALVLSTLRAVPNLTVIVLGLGLVGLGNGLFLSPNNNAIMSSVPRSQIGVGSGTLATMRNLGQVLGIAFSGAIFSSRLTAHAAYLRSAGYDPKLITNWSFAWALHDAYLGAMTVAILGMVVSMVRGVPHPALASDD